MSYLDFRFIEIANIGNPIISNTWNYFTIDGLSHIIRNSLTHSYPMCFEENQMMA